MSELPAAVAAWRDAGEFLDMDGRRIFAMTVGDAGPVVIILHGFPASSFDWRSVMPALARGARVIAFDYLGYGLSDKPLDPRMTMFDCADLAERVAAHFGVGECALLAHDVGDTVCAELLARHNEGTPSLAVSRVFLTNGSIFHDMAQLSAGQQLLLQLPDEPLAESLPLEGFRPGIAQTFSKEHQPSDEEFAAMMSLIANNDGDRLLPRLIRYVEDRRANQPRWTAALVDFAGPLTAFWGEQDPIAVLAMTTRLKELRPATEVVTWTDVAHWPSIEVPERLADAVLARLWETPPTFSKKSLDS